ncbi:MAG: hypothetical protein Q8R67_17295 [Rhodoferax sp.]|nr:hypothetical protein [Rhodoferax sp.]MDP3653425.1 hypothetical protein [Rhodoferax sp.]
MKKSRSMATVLAVLVGAFCAPGVAGTAHRFKGEVWADNWFSLHLGERFVAEDSVPITTERSFNAETFYFDASYPFDLNFVVKDYKENDTGLEYIGTPRQKMGDGGFVMQVTDTTTGKVVAVSNAAMRCLVLHKAPLNPGCARDRNPMETCQIKTTAEPAGWKAAAFDTTAWERATVYTQAQAGVKDGYFDIRWDPAAQLVWSSDLNADNTLLCKVRVVGP